MDELVQAIVEVGQGRWRNIALQFGWDFEKRQNLVTDYPSWASKDRLRKIVSDYKSSEGDNESSRQRLIDVCKKVGIGDALRDALNFREF